MLSGSFRVLFLVTECARGLSLLQQLIAGVPEGSRCCSSSLQKASSSSETAGELLSSEELLSIGCSLPLFACFGLGTEFAGALSLLLELIAGTGRWRVSVQ